MSLAWAGCVADDAPAELGTRAAPLLDGELDTENTWAVGICASAPNTDPALGELGACVVPGTRCTGSLIAPNLVLTVAHCVSDMVFYGPEGCDGHWTGQPFNDGGIHVTLGPSVAAANPTWLDVREVAVPSGNLCNGDLALLILDKPVPRREATPIAVDLRKLARHFPHTVDIVGRGVIAEVWDPVTGLPTRDTGGLQRRHLADIPTLCIGDDTGGCQVSGDLGDYVIPKGQFAIAKGPASGDSGSSVMRPFLDDPGFAGQGSAADWHRGVVDSRHPRRTIGVISSVTFDPVELTPNSAQAVRLDQHRDFIRAIAARASHEGRCTRAELVE